MKFLKCAVLDVKSVIDEIVKETKELGWPYPKIAYYNDLKVTLTYREKDLRKFPQLKEIQAKHSGISVRYPSAIVLENYTSGNQLQKYIIGKLTNMTYTQSRKLTISSCKTFIENKEHKSINDLPQELLSIFKCSDSDSGTQIAIDDNIFKTQLQFVEI